MALAVLRNRLARIVASVERKEIPVSTATFGFDAFQLPNALSGPAVSPQSAMCVPAVKACIELIATSIGTLPAKAFRRLEDGSKKSAPDHSAFKLVHRTANDFQSAGKLRELLATDALLHGNAFAYAVRVDGRVVELIRLDPRSVQIKPDPVTGSPLYVVNDASGKGQRTYTATDIMHVPALTSFDGLTGVSPITLNREAIALAITLEAHAARLFGRGARPSGTLNIPGKLSADAATRISQSWHAAHGGTESGKTAVLEEGARFEPLTFTSVDAQFAEMRTAQGYEIARAFNVQPAMIGIVDRATWGNAETQNRQFLMFTLRPWLAAFKAAYERLLLSDEERDTYLIDFITDDLVKADTAARAESYAKLRAAGVLTANEIRALENLPAHSEGDTLGSPFTTSNEAPPG